MPQESDRFLRAPALRDALYENAGGKCQNPACGRVLGRGWHADHAVPWVVSKTTNVFRMQALCRDCNLSKGAQYMTTGIAPRLPRGFHIGEESFRPGQRQAYLVTVDRVSANETHMAIVLPTRYGKTDYMRVTGLRLLRDGLVSAVLIMAPDKILRDQALDPWKTEQCWDRYHIDHQIASTPT